MFLLKKKKNLKLKAKKVKGEYMLKANKVESKIIYLDVERGDINVSSFSIYFNSLN